MAGVTMSNDWKSQLADVSKQIDVSIVRATREGTASLRHTPVSALSFVTQNKHELLADGQPLSDAVRQWLPKVRFVLRRGHNDRVLIIGCQRKNIDPQGSGFVDNDDQIILWENDESHDRNAGKRVPARVGVLFQARFMSHRRSLPLINEARERNILVVPVLKPTEIRQLLTYGRLSDEELLTRVQPRLPAPIQAAMRIASPEARAASDAVIAGGLQKWVKGEAVPDPVDAEVVDESPAETVVTAPAKRGFIQAFIDLHPALPGEGVSAQARRLLPLAMQHFRRPPALEKNTFRTLETTISTSRKRPAAVVPPTSAPPPEERPMPPPMPEEEVPPPPPPPVNNAPTSGPLDKTLSAIDALGDSLAEIELHAEQMSNHGTVLAEHGRQLSEQIGFAKFAIENLRGDLRAGVHADIEQRVRAALVHVMGPLA